jgi:lysophospholipase L1-like esterase
LIASACVIVIMGATVLAIEPDEPRDRAAPPLSKRLDKPIRVTFLGTSLSAPSRYTWPDEVGRHLAARTGLPVDVRRVTEPGATSTWGSRQIDNVLSTDPDVVVIEMAVNDADVRHRLTLHASVAQHEHILAGLTGRQGHPAIVLLTMNPATGIRAWARPFLSRFYAEYVALAERYDTGLVDLYARWLRLPHFERELVDGLHPSDVAATRMIVGPVVDSLEAMTSQAMR